MLLGTFHYGTIGAAVWRKGLTLTGFETASEIGLDCAAGLMVLENSDSGMTLLISDEITRLSYS
jgi:hypothetical protein